MNLAPVSSSFRSSSLGIGSIPGPIITDRLVANNASQKEAACWRPRRRRGRTPQAGWRNWRFEATEISAGVYLAVGRGPKGQRIEITDVEPERALSGCRA